jgi:hypothetical protein
MKRILNWLFPKQPKMVIETSTIVKRQYLMMKVKTLFQHDERYDEACTLVCLLSCEGIDYIHRLNRQDTGLNNAGLDAWISVMEDTYAMGEKLPAWCKA